MSKINNSYTLSNYSSTINKNFLVKAIDIDDSDLTSQGFSESLEIAQQNKDVLTGIHLATYTSFRGGGILCD